MTKAWVEENLEKACCEDDRGETGGCYWLDRDATRESVSVPISRGRENNLLYMVTEQAPDGHDQRRIEDTPVQRLTDILARSDVAEAALTVREVAEHDTASFETLGALINQVSMRASGGRNAVFGR